MGNHYDSDDSDNGRKSKKKKHSRSRSASASSYESKRSAKKKKKVKRRNRSKSHDRSRKLSREQGHRRSQSRSISGSRERKRKRRQSISSDRSVRRRSRSISYDRKRSPTLRRRSRSITPRRRSRSHTPRKRSPSRTPRQRSRSPKRRSFSRSPKRKSNFRRSYSRSPSPKRLRSPRRRSRTSRSVSPRRRSPRRQSPRRRSLSRSPGRRRSRSPEYTRISKIKRERSDSGSPASDRNRALTDKSRDDSDPALTIPGYDMMTPSEQAEARMQIALKAAAAADKKLIEQGVVFTSGKEITSQLERAKIIDSIESGGFTAGVFSSSRSTKDNDSGDLPSHEDAIFGTGGDFPSFAANRPRMVYEESDTLLHPIYYEPDEVKMERWRNKLRTMRKQQLEGHVITC